MPQRSVLALFARTANVEREERHSFEHERERQAEPQVDHAEYVQHKVADGHFRFEGDLLNLLVEYNFEQHARLSSDSCVSLNNFSVEPLRETVQRRVLIDAF